MRDYVLLVLVVGLFLLTGWKAHQEHQGGAERIRILQDSVATLQAQNDSLRSRVEFEARDLEGFRLRCYVKEGPE